MGKKRISKSDLIETLKFWLSRIMLKNIIKDRASDFKFEIKSHNDFKKISDELFLLNLWIIVHTCEIVITDMDVLDDALDKFHHMVYKTYIPKEKVDYDTWKKLLEIDYDEYHKAADKIEPTTPPVEIAVIFTRRLFNQFIADPGLQMKIVNYITLNIEHLGRVLINYEVY